MTWLVRLAGTKLNVKYFLKNSLTFWNYVNVFLLLVICDVLSVFKTKHATKAKEFDVYCFHLVFRFLLIRFNYLVIFTFYLYARLSYEGNV